MPRRPVAHAVREAGTVATTSARALKLLSVLGAGETLTATELSERLGVSERTVRRDIGTLRDLGYAVDPARGLGGGYRLGTGSRLPPLTFDEEQVVAIAVALQTAPVVLTGIADSCRRALSTVRQVMPERLRIESDAFDVTAIANYWEFPASAIDADVVRAVGSAVRRRHVLRLEYDEGAGGPMRVEPHHLVVWAARWYLVAFDLDADRWRVLRVDRITAKTPTYVPFGPRELPTADAATLVRSTWDRGDRPAEWPCLGSVVIDVPPPLVAEFIPGGGVVEYVSDASCRLTLGAWSWIGLAGLLLTFAADMHDIEPAELREAFGMLRDRLARMPEV